MINKEAMNEDNIDIILILEHCHGNLHKIIESKKKKGDKGLPEQFILKILYDITNGISHLHQYDPPIVHRDIRTENILLGSDGNYKI